MIFIYIICTWCIILTSIDVGHVLFSHVIDLLVYVNFTCFSYIWWWSYQYWLINFYILKVIDDLDAYLLCMMVLIYCLWWMLSNSLKLYIFDSLILITNDDQVTVIILLFYIYSTLQILFWWRFNKFNDVVNLYGCLFP